MTRSPLPFLITSNCSLYIIPKVKFPRHIYIYTASSSSLFLLVLGGVINIFLSHIASVIFACFIITITFLIIFTATHYIDVKIYNEPEQVLQNFLSLSFLGMLSIPGGTRPSTWLIFHTKNFHHCYQYVGCTCKYHIKDIMVALKCFFDCFPAFLRWTRFLNWYNVPCSDPLVAL